MSSMGMAGAVAPALLKSRSRRPNASLILAKSARTERGSPTSVGTGSIVPPEGSPDAAVRSSSAARRPASATEYPAACKARLTARPMPLPAPVTSAILPVFAIFVSIVRQPARAASWLHAPRHPLRAQPDPLDGYHQVRHVPADALGGREPARGAHDGGGAYSFYVNDFSDTPQFHGGQDPMLPNFMLRIAVFAIYSGMNAAVRDRKMRRLAGVVLLASALGLCADAPTTDLALKDAGRRKVRLRDLRGKVVLLNFWATWCGPCNAEMPALVDLEKQYADRGVAFIGASLDDEKSTPKIPAFVSRYKIDFPIWYGATLDDLDRLKMNNAVPATAFLDAEGPLVARIFGQARPEEVRERLDWLAGDRSGPAPLALVKHLQK